MPSLRPISVTAFVDWNSQIYNSRADKHDTTAKAKRTLEKTTNAISRMLLGEDPNRRFDVVLRLYHGWHTGWQKTDNLVAIMTTVADPGFPSDYSERNVLFRQAVQFGHTLLSALPVRQHSPQQIHLANTLRRQNASWGPEEKMVDTALAADLLHWARATPSDWALVLAEDDDIVPPVFTAEAWIDGHGGRMFIVRNRRATQYAKLDGILRELRR